MTKKIMAQFQVFKCLNELFGLSAFKSFNVDIMLKNNDFFIKKLCEKLLLGYEA